MMREEVRDGEGTLLALVISNRKGGVPTGIEFLGDPSHAIQVAQMRWPDGHEIARHIHIPVERVTVGTPEVIMLREGSMRADFYDLGRRKVWSTVCDTGDILVLLAGGHGFTMLSECVLEEVKLGPYLGADDKVRF